MARELLKTLLGSLTLSAANTFTQQSLNTNIDAPAALLIKAVEFSWNEALNANAEQIEIQLTQDSKTSMVGINDKDVIAKMTREEILATSGVHIDPYQQMIVLPKPGIIVVRDTIYLGGNSAGLAGVATYQVKVYYEQIKLSTAEALTLTL